MRYALKKINYLLPILLVVLLSGCATTRAVSYEETARKAKPHDYKIETYDSAGIHRPYKVIGVAIASTGPFHHMMDAIDHLQQRAREMGGDALVDLAQGLPEGADMPEGGWFIFGTSGEIWSAKVIIWE